jgi:hypothetical protein
MSNAPLISLFSPSINQGFFIPGKFSSISPNFGSEEFGFSVSEAGDINNDGIDDLIIGARHSDVGDQDKAGKAFVIFGDPNIGVGGFDLTSLNGSNGFVVHGINGGDRLGHSVSNAGDFNNDGIDDLVIGSLFNSGGRIYVIFGKDENQTEPFSSVINLSELNSNRFQGFSFRISSPSGERPDNLFGFSISAAGDVNQDGVADLIVGVPGPSSTFDPQKTTFGRSYVLYGRALNSPHNTFGIQFDQIKGVTRGDRSGNSVSGVGDVDGDGIPDVLIAARDANGNAGQSYLVFGSALNSTSFLDLANLDSSGSGFKLNGTGRSGWVVSGAGDVDGNGLNDLLIGAPSITASPDQNPNPIAPDSPGKVYVVLGEHLAARKQAGNFSPLNLETEAFVIQGETNGDGAGFSVSDAGDINADGFADIIIGAPYADGTSLFGNAGRSYVIYGGQDKDIVTGGRLNLQDLQSDQGLILEGAFSNDRSGWSVSKAGDINNDGVDDLIIGAIETGTLPGRVDIVFGNARPILDLNGSTTVGNDFEAIARIGQKATSIVSIDLQLTDNIPKLKGSNIPNPDRKTIAGATVKITNPLDGVAEQLTADTTGTGIFTIYDADTGTLTLNGVDTVANYQQVLRTVQYQNTAASTNFTDRTIEFVVKDTGVFNTESEVAKTVVQLLPPNHVLLEAENLNLETYRVEDNPFASGGKLISLQNAVGTMGAASTQFTGETGAYHVIVRYLDETDGKAQLDFRVNGNSIDRWTLDKDLGSGNPTEQTFTERLVGSVSLETSDTLSLVGTAESGEWARIDSIELIPVQDFIQIEAENMSLSTYHVEDNSFASGDKLISLRDASGGIGTASTQFVGESGSYDITVGYLDENDGNAKLELQVDGSLIDLWSLDKNLGSADPVEQTFIERRIKGVFLDTGASLTLVGTQDSSEWARVDFLRITPAISSVL